MAMSATAIQEGHVFEAALKAVIIYDNAVFPPKTQAMLECASLRAGEATEWDTRHWQLDALLSLPTAAEALKDANDADLIVLALQEAGSIRAELLDWLAIWATHRQRQEAGLAVWNSGGSGSSFFASLAELSRFAKCHGLSLIYDDERVEHRPLASARSLRERELAITPTLQKIMDWPIHGDRRGWGTND